MNDKESRVFDSVFGDRYDFKVKNEPMYSHSFDPDFCTKDAFSKKDGGVEEMKNNKCVCEVNQPIKCPLHPDVPSLLHKEGGALISTTKKDDGGPAFSGFTSPESLAVEHRPYKGMTLRQYYIGQSLREIINHNPLGYSLTPKEIANRAIDIADAVIKNEKK